MEFQTSEEGVEFGLGKVGNALIAVTLDDELELVFKEEFELVNLHGLGLFRGEEGLEAALDFTHCAFGLFIESLEFFHLCNSVGDVVSEGDIKAIDRIHFNLDNLVADTHISHVEEIAVYSVKRDIYDADRLPGILVFNDYDILDYRKFG